MVISNDHFVLNISSCTKRSSIYSSRLLCSHSGRRSRCRSRNSFGRNLISKFSFYVVFSCFCFVISSRKHVRPYYRLISHVHLNHFFIYPIFGQLPLIHCAHAILRIVVNDFIHATITSTIILECLLEFAFLFIPLMFRRCVIVWERKIESFLRLNMLSFSENEIIRTGIVKEQKNVCAYRKI